MTPDGNKIYTINISSRFILTQSQVKQALGIGYKILSVEQAKDADDFPVVNVDTAAEAIIKVGFRALAMAYHPDRGGDEEKFKILNQTKEN